VGVGIEFIVYLNAVFEEQNNIAWYADDAGETEDFAVIFCFCFEQDCAAAQESLIRRGECRHCPVMPSEEAVVKQQGAGWVFRGHSGVSFGDTPATVLDEEEGEGGGEDVEEDAAHYPYHLVYFRRRQPLQTSSQKAHLCFSFLLLIPTTSVVASGNIAEPTRLCPAFCYYIGFFCDAVQLPLQFQAPLFKLLLCESAWNEERISEAHDAAGERFWHNEAVPGGELPARICGGCEWEDGRA